MSKKVLISQIFIIILFLIVSISFFIEGKILSFIVFVLLTLVFSSSIIIGVKNGKDKNETIKNVENKNL